VLGGCGGGAIWWDAWRWELAGWRDGCGGDGCLGVWVWPGVWMHSLSLYMEVRLVSFFVGTCCHVGSVVARGLGGWRLYCLLARVLGLVCEV